MTVYGKAYLRALTPETIRSAFRKTGVCPFDRSVVTKEMMAPSKETSCEGFLPIQPLEPIKIITQLLKGLSIHEDIPETSNDDDSLPSNPTSTSSQATSSRMVKVQEAFEQLSQTEFSYLVSASDPCVSSLEHNVTAPILLRKPSYTALLDITPKITFCLIFFLEGHGSMETSFPLLNGSRERS